MFDNKSIMVTGGTGSFGRKFIAALLKRYKPTWVVIFSRDEVKQFAMQQESSAPCMRYFLGDVRDRERLLQAMRGIDLVVHTAALKKVPVILPHYLMQDIDTEGDRRRAELTYRAWRGGSDGAA